MVLVTMYVRTSTRKRADGTSVSYLQLAHNEWDAERQRSVAKILYSFGRADEVDRDAIGRLVVSLSRLLSPEQTLQATAPPGLTWVSSKRLGGTWVLDQLWRRLGIDRAMRRLLKGRRLDERAERVLFALVANRALAATSKLGATAWVADEVAIDGLEAMDADSCYRAMDWLVEIEDELAETVYAEVANLLNLEVDLLFFDTTSTYFELDAADVDGEDGEVGFRTYGKSKDHREDLPQVIVGLAVTREGIPIRVWSWPGNTADTTLIAQVKDELRAWKLARVVWVCDRGFTSAANRRYLQRAGGHYIMAEKLRAGTGEAEAALSRQGRYRTVAGNLEIKQITIDGGTMRDRFVVCRNPERAERDRLVREQIVGLLEAEIADSDRLTHTKRAELYGALKTKPAFNRFLRTTKGGRLRIDRAAITAEERLDGKFLLRTSDPTLSAEDVALGYKQLAQVERGWRDLKTTLELRPVYHRLQRRIHAHVLLCWLALLLMRIAENTTGDTWRQLRHELQQLHVGQFTGPAGTVELRTATTHAQRRILAALHLGEPPQISRLDANQRANSA